MTLESILSIVLGSGVGAGVANLIFKARLDKELELERTRLQRQSSLLERQSDKLLRLHTHLFEVVEWNQSRTRNVRLSGESADIYNRLVLESVAKAREEFGGARLLLPPELVTQIETFLRRFLDVEIALAGTIQMPPGRDMKAAWDEIQKTSFEEIPALLHQIEKKARAILDGSALRT